MQRISKSSYGISISVLSDAKQQKNHLNEKESQNKNRTEIALSETRHLVFQQNEDFNYSSVSDFEYRYSCNLNTRLNNQKADLLLRWSTQLSPTSSSISQRSRSLRMGR